MIDVVYSLDESYFNYLCELVVDVRPRNPSRTFWSLLNQLHNKEFIWLIPNDDNRVEDGKDLRGEFLDQANVPAGADWFGQGCSMLEMLIALSRRLSFEVEGEPRDWFWHFLDMIGINNYTDRRYTPNAEDKIDEALERVIFRTYEPNGRGGLFPVQNPETDLRQAELWYQLCAYAVEL